MYSLTNAPRPRFFTALAERRTWSEFWYALIGLPIGAVGFAFTVSEISVGATLLVTIVGLPVIAVTGLASRVAGSQLRALANRMIGANVPPAQSFRAKPGRFGWLVACLSDGTAWRARLYLALKLPIGIASFVAAATFLGYGLAGVTYAVWRPFLPCDGRRDNVCHRAAHLGQHYFDTPVQITLVFVAGIVLTLLAPWVVRSVLVIDKVAIRALLGPTTKTPAVTTTPQVTQCCSA